MWRSALARRRAKDMLRHIHKCSIKLESLLEMTHQETERMKSVIREMERMM